MRRLQDVYAQMAADRDHSARMVAEMALMGQWDLASDHAKTYKTLTRRCDQLIEGRLRLEEPPQDTA